MGAHFLLPPSASSIPFLPGERKGIMNFVRLAVPRNVYGVEHLDYTVAAVTELHRNRGEIPRVEVVRGRELHLRHFQSGLRPTYGRG